MMFHARLYIKNFIMQVTCISISNVLFHHASNLHKYPHQLFFSENIVSRSVAMIDSIMQVTGIRNRIAIYAVNHMPG
jgi:hypothetical protein